MVNDEKRSALLIRDLCGVHFCRSKVGKAASFELRHFGKMEESKASGQTGNIQVYKCEQKYIILTWDCGQLRSSYYHRLALGKMEKSEACGQTGYVYRYEQKYITNMGYMAILKVGSITDWLLERVGR